MRLALIALTAALILAGSVSAQAQAPAAATSTVSQTSTTSKAMKAAAKPRTAISIACSGKADEAKAHGKARKAFMRSCKKEAAKG